MGVTRIREATLEDSVDILALAHRFLAGTRYGQVLPYSPEALATLLLYLLEKKAGVVYLGEERGGGCDNYLEGVFWPRWNEHLCARCSSQRSHHWRGVGMIGGIAGTNPISGEGMVEELVWWVNPEARGRTLAYKLLGSLENWARQNGYGMLKMVAPVEVDAATGAQSCPVGAFYTRLGYLPLETVFFKRL